MDKALYVILAVLILMQPGCTFYSWGNGVQPRKTAELAGVSPVIYMTLAVFGVILIVSIACVLFRETKQHADNNLFAGATAIIAIIVIMFLVG